MLGKQLRVQRVIFYAIPMKCCSNDHFADMQQKTRESGGKGEERKKRKHSFFMFIISCFSQYAYLAYKWAAQKCSLPPQRICKRYLQNIL